MVRTQTTIAQPAAREETARFHPALKFLKSTIKRLFDISLSAFGIIILAPFLTLIALLIQRDSPGPIFFWGTRAGRNGKPFRILKFRTMYERPESYAGPRVTAEGDSRITPLGAWLRYTKINELPQLWNVLTGDMSLVGPRPEDVEIAKHWPEEAHREILSVRPGITSPASILYHDEEKHLSPGSLMEDYLQSILPNKMRLDRLYVRYPSFSTDLDILFWTMAILIPRLTSTQIPEGYLFAGPFSRFVHRYANWFIVDFLVAACSVGLVSIFWPPESASWGLNALAVLSLLITLLFSSLNTISGQNRILWSRSSAEDGLGLLLSGSLTFCFVLLICESNRIANFLTFPDFPASMLIIINMLALVGFIVARYRLRVISGLANRWLNLRQDRLKLGERVLIVGAGEGSQIAGWLLKRRIFRTAFSIIGIVDEIDPTLHGLRIGGTPILGGLLDLPVIIKKQDIGVILSTIPATNPTVDEYIFDLCRSTGLRLVFLDDLLNLVDKQVTQPRQNSSPPAWRLDHLEFKAIHDITTQLPNRYLLQERLQHSISYARRYDTRVAILFIDLPSLADINHILGHKYGDELLILVAQRLMLCKRESDTLARTSDHQFTLILEHLARQSETTLIARRIYDSLLQPLQLNGRKFSLDASLGIFEADTLENSGPLDMTDCYQKRTLLKDHSHHEYALAQ
jgi:diguanylate cyclase (GGDEF)-like protein